MSDRVEPGAPSIQQPSNPFTTVETPIMEPQKSVTGQPATPSPVAPMQDLPADRPDQATVTYDMNRLMNLESDHRFLVTLNDSTAIDPARVLRTFSYHHPVYVAGRAQAQRRHEELIGVNRTSYCGAYWGYGFHEDGVRSALHVASAFGRTLA